MVLTTRPANLEDELFSFELYVDTRKPEIASWGWSPEQIELFLRMQYEAQSRSYSSQAVPLIEEIVLCGEEKVGRLLTREADKVLTIVDIALLSAFRNQGLGTELIRRNQHYAQDKGLAIELHVLSGNPASRLYSRLGFEVTGEAPPYLAMKWTP
jgi:ribosomal protein S18 acetylase RimI-like enzyme